MIERLAPRLDERLLISGWDDSLPPLLRALSREAGLTACAIGDHRAAPLVSARNATGAPCYQHVREMLRLAEADAVLAGAAGAVPDAAERAAARGQDLLLLGAAMDGPALATAAAAASRHGVPCFVLRPALRSAGYAYLEELLASEPHWRPRALDIELRGPGDPAALLRDAVAMATALLPVEPAEAVGSFAGSSAPAATTLAVQLRYADGGLVALTTGAAPDARLRIVLDAPTRHAEVRTAARESDLELAVRGVDVQHLLLRDRDLCALEARRIATARAQGADDSASLLTQATTLRAIEAALETGLVQALEAFAPRPALRALGGGAERPTPPSGRLHVVTY